MQTNRESERSNRNRNGMRTKARALGLVLCAAALLVTPLTAPAQDPDFSNIDDILLGRRDLVPVDDIVFAYVRNGNEQVRQYFPTQDGQPLTSPVTIGTGPSDNVGNAPLILVEPIFDIDGRATQATVVQNGGVSEIHVLDLNRSGSVQTLSTVVARWAPGDFNGDGFTDLALRTSNPNQLMIATAVDLKDVSQGLRFGPALQLPSDGFPTAGDFDGDGVDEIAILLKSSSLGCSGTPDLLQIYSVDPDTLKITEITPHGSTCVDPPGSDTIRHAIAGHFAPIARSDLEPGRYPPQQLAVVFGGNSVTSSGKTSFAMVEVDPETMQPAIKGRNLEGTSAFTVIDSYGTQSVGGQLIGPDAGFIAANGFPNPVTDLPQRTEALVMINQVRDSQSQPQDHINIATFAFDGDLNVVSDWEYSYHTTDFCPSGTSAGDILVEDVGLGSFASALEQPSDLNLQLAVGLRCGSQLGVRVSPYSDPDEAIFGFSTAEFGHFVSAAGNATSSIAIAPGDMQHRSLRLGEPTVARFAVSQPDITLGAPPMHVDYVVPANESEATDLNMSAIVFAGAGFSASYDTAVEGTNQSTQSSTTSFSTGVNVGGDADLQIERRLWQVDGTLEGAIEAEYESSVENSFDTYAGAGLDASFETGFRDLIYFQNRRMNVYAYPVLGSTSCPADNPDCTSNQELPTYVLYSGMDRIRTAKANLDAIEWYQPPHEPGNILSYPATPGLLEAGRLMTDPNFDLFGTALTPTNAVAFTDDSVETVRYEWSAGMGTDLSVGSSSTQGVDVSASASVRIGRKKESGANESGVEVTLEGSYDQNSALETLQTSTQEIGASSGIEVSKPPTFREPSHYQYGYQGIVFGRPFPAGTGHEPTTSADLAATGILELAFTADPTSFASGDWWSSLNGYRSAPDVALNHPSRWDTFQSSGSPSDTCLPAASGGTSLSCVEFQDPPDFTTGCEDLSCIWTNNFLKMRGVFVSSADAEGGSQRQAAVAGELLKLQLRVYNYSLTPMPPGTEVHVRFYCQPWNPRTNTANGSSVLIDEVVHDPIPRFSTVSLNWDLVSTTFDTTGLDDSYQIFWAVVWMEDSNGQLVEEIEDHGLTAVPGVLENIAGVPIEEHSNNVGFYNSVFYIFPPPEAGGASAGVAALQASSGQDARAARVSLEQQQLRVRPERVEPGGQADVSVSLHAEGDDAEGIFVTFYDGDPESGELFDIERVAFIRAGDSYEARVGYHPHECGEHDIYAVVRSASNGLTDARTASTTLDVACDQATGGDHGDDDGCAIAAGRGSGPAWVLLLGGLLLFAANRGRRSDVDRLG
jgi:hypothetical protein